MAKLTVVAPTVVVFSNTDTLFWAMLATMISGRPSLFTSASARNQEHCRWETFAGQQSWEWRRRRHRVQQHRHRVGLVVGDDDVGQAVAV